MGKYKLVECYRLVNKKWSEGMAMDFKEIWIHAGCE